jgi:hypothetical protein
VALRIAPARPTLVVDLSGLYRTSGDALIWAQSPNDPTCRFPCGAERPTGHLAFRLASYGLMGVWLLHVASILRRDTEFVLFEGGKGPEKPSRALALTFPVHQQNIDAFLARRAA